MFWLNRTALHETYYAPFYSEYDPFRNLRHAQAEQGWIIDYCHCPLEEAIHPHKDCSQAQLRRRFETVLAEGGDQVWCAVPEEVVFYHACRRHLTVETLDDNQDQRRYRLDLPGLSPRVTCRQLSLEVDVPPAWCRFPRVWVDGRQQAADLVRPGVLRLTLSVAQGTELRLGAQG